MTCSNPCIDTGKRSLCCGVEVVRISSRLSRASNIKKECCSADRFKIKKKKKLTSTPKEIIKLNTVLYKTTKIINCQKCFPTPAFHSCSVSLFPRLVQTNSIHHILCEQLVIVQLKARTSQVETLRRETVCTVEAKARLMQRKQQEWKAQGVEL